MDNVICPKCGAPMTLRETKKHLYPKSQEPRKFYGCSKWPQCDATHGAHPDGRPLGIPGDEETKLLRSRCHRLIDELACEMPKGLIYSKLEELLGLGSVHFGALGKQDCFTVINYLEELKEEVLDG